MGYFDRTNAQGPMIGHEELADLVRRGNIVKGQAREGQATYQRARRARRLKGYTPQTLAELDERDRQPLMALRADGDKVAVELWRTQTWEFSPRRFVQDAVARQVTEDAKRAPTPARQTKLAELAERRAQLRDMTNAALLDAAGRAIVAHQFDELVIYMAEADRRAAAGAEVAEKARPWPRRDGTEPPDINPRTLPDEIDKRLAASGLFSYHEKLLVEARRLGNVLHHALAVLGTDEKDLGAELELGYRMLDEGKSGDEVNQAMAEMRHAAA